MKESHKVILLVALTSLGLFWATVKFRSSSDDYASKLDFGDIAYLDPDAPIDLEEPAPEPAQVYTESLDGEAEAVPERDTSEELSAQSAEMLAEEAERADSDADMQERGDLTDGEEDDDEKAEAEDDPDTEAPTRAAKMRPVRAIDVKLPFDTVATCRGSADAIFRTGIYFRPGSAAIRGESLSRIDTFVELWRRCGGGEVLVDPAPADRVDGDTLLADRRLDEVKYYLLQRSVPKADIVYADPS